MKQLSITTINEKELLVYNPQDRNSHFLQSPAKEVFEALSPSANCQGTNVTTVSTCSDRAYNTYFTSDWVCGDAWLTHPRNTTGAPATGAYAIQCQYPGCTGTGTYTTVYCSDNPNCCCPDGVDTGYGCTIGPHLTGDDATSNANLIC